MSNKVEWYEYDGPQCAECGKEDLTPRFVCGLCDALVCTACQEEHSSTHMKAKIARVELT